jgi:hypothetical protein
MAKLAAASKIFLKAAPDYFQGHSFIFFQAYGPGNQLSQAGQEDAKGGEEVLGGRCFSVTF